MDVVKHGARRRAVQLIRGPLGRQHMDVREAGQVMLFPCWIGFALAAATLLGATPASAHADTGAVSHEDTLRWSRSVESGAVLCWMGEEFFGPFEIDFVDPCLTINGSEVGWPQVHWDFEAEREPTALESLHARAREAASLEEFVRIYSDSPLVAVSSVEDYNANGISQHTVHYSYERPLGDTGETFEVVGHVTYGRGWGAGSQPTRESILIGSLESVARMLESRVAVFYSGAIFATDKPYKGTCRVWWEGRRDRYGGSEREK